MLAYLSFQQIRDYQARSPDMDLVRSAHKLQSNSLDLRLLNGTEYLLSINVVMVVVLLLILAARQGYAGKAKAKMKMTDVAFASETEQSSRIIVIIIICLYAKNPLVNEYAHSFSHTQYTTHTWNDRSE